MKGIVRDAGIVFLVALIAAGLTWAVIGPPDRSVPCHPEELKSGWVCLEALESQWENILWVDARSRKMWERNGVEGSLLLTDHNLENWDDLVAEAAERLFVSSHVVVYCNENGCGSSQAVAEKIRELQLVDRVDVLFGGWKALRAAGFTGSK